MYYATAGGPDAGLTKWESSDPSIARISTSGLVTALFPGVVTITARLGPWSRTRTVTVIAGRLEISPVQVNLALDSSRLLTATVYDAYGAILRDVAVSWSSQDAIIASIDASSGLVTGRAWGGTRITATGGGVSNSVAVTIATASNTIVFSDIDVGGSHICGLETATQIAYCWGDNHAGALGAGMIDGSDLPVQVSGARRFKQLSVGFYATCGIEVQTALAYCWGSNFWGDLGDGTATTRWTPTLVANGSIRFSEISASGDLTCGVEAQTGFGFCWGKGGLIGDGTSSQRLLPTRIAGDLRFSTIVTAGSYACGVVTPTGIVYCWGESVYGQIGDGTTARRLTPTMVDNGIIRFSHIDADAGTTCGVETDTGFAYCWGRNVFGQVGDGTTVDRLVPTRVRGDLRFTSVDAGDLTCGIEAGTSVAYCWGRDRAVPTLVGDGSRQFSSVSASHGAAWAVEAETGRVYYWNYLEMIPCPLFP